VRRLPARAWLVLRRAADALVRSAGTRDAAQVAFFVLLSFPATLLLLVWGISAALDDPAGLREDIVAAIVDTIPLSDAEGRTEIEELLDDVANGAGGLGFAVIPALIYSASGAIGALRHAVNEAFETRDDRPWVQGKLLDIGLVLIVAPLAVGGLALKLSNTVPAALDDEPLAQGVTAFLLTELAPLAIAFGLLVGLLRILPAAEVRVRDAWPGALVAVVGLRLAQALAEAVLSLFGSAGTVYGAIGGLLAAGYAVYLSCVVIVAGAHVSAQLARLPTGPAIDSAIAGEGPGKPVGRFLLDAVRGLFVRDRRG
jgi:membrane protein